MEKIKSFFWPIVLDLFSHQSGALMNQAWDIGYSEGYSVASDEYSGDYDQGYEEGNDSGYSQWYDDAEAQYE